MAKHAHIYGAQATHYYSVPSNLVWHRNQFSCIECGHKPNHKTLRNLQKQMKENPKSIPADNLYVVVTARMDLKRSTGYYTTVKHWNSVVSWGIK